MVLYVRELFKRIEDFVARYRDYDDRSNYFFISIGAAFFTLFIFLSFMGHYLIYGNWNFDMSTIQYIHNLRTERLNSIFKIVTRTGNTIPVIMLTLLVSFVLFYAGCNKDGVFFMYNTFGLWIFNEMLKHIFKRPRPSNFRIMEASGYSFPSGHAMISMGFSVLLVYHIVAHIRNRKGAFAICMLIFMYPVVIGLSRVYIGVHYLSDVMAGWMAGVLWSSSNIVIYKFLSYKRHFVQISNNIVGYKNIGK